MPRGEDSKELIIGDEQWPFPVPLVKSGNKWQFDSEVGKQEVLARRIGGNELGVIDICRDYVRHAAGICQSVRTTANPQESLLSTFAALPAARTVFIGRRNTEKSTVLLEISSPRLLWKVTTEQVGSDPLWGYHFRILTAQGPAAPGGKKSYVKNGDHERRVRSPCLPGQICIQRRHDLRSQSGWRRLPKGSWG